MKILHVTPYYEGAWAYGGIPRVVGALAREQARRGHRVTVCTTDACERGRRLARAHVSARGASRGAQDEDALHLDAAFPEVVVFRNLSNALAYHLQLYAPVGLGAYLRAHAATFDVAHLHACHQLPSAIAARVLARAGVPYLLAPNGTAPNIERRQWAKAIFDRTAGRRLIPGARRVVAVTDAERRQLEQIGIPASRVAVIPNPVDLSEFEPAPARGAFRQRYALGDGPLVVFMARMSPRKRPELVAEAVARLDRSDIHIVFAGNDAGAGPRLARAVHRLGLGPRTHLTGLLRGHARLEALADADVVVYPSSDEIFGLVAVEALLCGTPVVVADDSGCGEVVRATGGGLAVKGTPEAVCAAVRDVLEHLPLWRAHATNAAALIPGLFGADVVCRQLQRVYEEMVSHGTYAA